jgi:hypothetical protein
MRMSSSPGGSRCGLFLAAALWLVVSGRGAQASSLSESQVSYTTIQVTGAVGTYPMAINESMAVTGYYMASSTVAKSFVRSPDGAITTFAVPNAIWTEAVSINAAGDITGFFEMKAGNPQGFLRSVNGRIVEFAPECGVCVPYPVGINDYGEIVGNYPFPTAVSKGFRRSPTGASSYIELAEILQYSNYATVITGLNNDGSVIGYVPYSSVSFITHPDGYTVPFSVPPHVTGLRFCFHSGRGYQCGGRCGWALQQLPGGYCGPLPDLSGGWFYTLRARRFHLFRTSWYDREFALDSPTACLRPDNRTIAQPERQRNRGRHVYGLGKCFSRLRPQPLRNDLFL